MTGPKKKGPGTGSGSLQIRGGLETLALTREFDGQRPRTFVQMGKNRIAGLAAGLEVQPGPRLGPLAGDRVDLSFTDEQVLLAPDLDLDPGIGE